MRGVASTRRATGALLAVVAGVMIAGGCANTIDGEPETAGSSAATSTTLPAGTTADLLTRLADGSTGLSARIVDNDGDREALAELEQLWAAARPDVAATDDLAARQIDRAMALLRRGVDRNVPADADKGAANLRTVIDQV